MKMAEEGKRTPRLKKEKWLSVSSKNTLGNLNLGNPVQVVSTGIEKESTRRIIILELKCSITPGTYWVFNQLLNKSTSNMDTHK